jgi:hypothetical protein
MIFQKSLWVNVAIKLVVLQEISRRQDEVMEQRSLFSLSSHSEQLGDQCHLGIVNLSKIVELKQEKQTQKWG